jgi:hypothetical protein
MLNQYGIGTEKNSTKASRFYNMSAQHEPNAYYPSLFMKYSIQFENSNLTEILSNFSYSLISSITNSGPILYGIIVFLILYAIFFFSLYFQKE